MIQQRKNGFTEVILIAGCKVDIFNATLDWLKRKIGIDFCEQDEQDGKIGMKFKYSDTTIMILYDPTEGISLYPAKRENATVSDNEAFDKFINVLQSL